MRNFGLNWYIFQRKICVHLTTIWPFFAWRSYVLTCKTFNINVAASLVGFVPEFNCCGINFGRHTNPNLLDWCQTMRNFGHDTNANAGVILSKFSCSMCVCVCWYNCVCKICVCLVGNIMLVLSSISFLVSCVCMMCLYSNI